MTNVVVAEPKKIPFNIIHPSYSEDFVKSVLDAYKMQATHMDYPIMPDEMYIDQGDFSEYYEDPQAYLFASLVRHEHPEEHWEYLTQEEEDDVDEKMHCNYIQYERFLLEDIEMVLDVHQLFYVRCTYEHSPFTDPSEAYVDVLLTDPVNSPIQSIW